MVLQKIALIVQKLYKQTEKGEIVWEKTLDKNVFQTSLPKYSLQISKEERLDVDYGVPVTFEYYKISFFNSEGNLIEDITGAQLSKELPNAEDILKSMFTTARRIALNAEEAFDEIITELEGNEH